MSYINFVYYCYCYYRVNQTEWFVLSVNPDVMILKVVGVLCVLPLIEHLANQLGTACSATYHEHFTPVHRHLMNLFIPCQVMLKSVELRIETPFHLVSNLELAYRFTNELQLNEVNILLLLLMIIIYR